MPVKVIWDYTYYWALLAPLFFGQRLTNIPLLGKLRPQFMRGRALNLGVQALLREWGQHNTAPLIPDGRFLDQYVVDWFKEMNRALLDELDDQAFTARINDNVARMNWLAGEILARARSSHPGIDGHGLDELLSDSNETSRSLTPQWYADAA